ncbi:MAG: helix-turn-helix transcriptional regulator [Planctomycetota bacterium]
MTPLQETVYRLIADYEARNERKLSGRELSAMIGKSRNHLSQIMNDGLVPSGEVLLKLGEALEADEETQRQLVLDAMRTKIGDRARDTFWLRHALELTDSLVERVDGFEEFLSSAACSTTSRAGGRPRPRVERERRRLLLARLIPTPEAALVPFELRGPFPESTSRR